MNHLTSGVISVKEDLFDNLNNKKIPYLTNEAFLDLASKFLKTLMFEINNFGVYIMKI